MYRIAKVQIEMVVNSSIHMSSEYEQNVGTLLAEKMQKLEELEKKPDAKNDQKKILMSEIETLQSLFENYNLGMNYFRRARGGRTGLRE